MTVLDGIERLGFMPASAYNRRPLPTRSRRLGDRFRPVDNEPIAAEALQVRTGSREFLEWIDLDEKDFRAIATFCRRILRLTLLLIPLAVVAVLIILHAGPVFSWFRSP